MTPSVTLGRVTARAAGLFVRERSYLWCSALLLSTYAQGQPAYDVLIEQARAGSYAPALSFLRTQLNTSQSGRFFQDHLRIAGWAGEDSEVIALFEQRPADLVLQADALASVARAYRNQHQWPESLAVYRKGLARFAVHGGLQSGEIMTLADAGQVNAAILLGKARVAKAPGDVELRLALGYAYLRNDQPYAALAEMDQAHRLAPERPDVLREYVLSLQRAGLPQQAYFEAKRHPGLLDSSQLRLLEGDILAEQVRLADMATRTEIERFRIADQALLDALRLLRQWSGNPQAHSDVVRVRIDRLGALHARVQMAELLAEYQQLQAEKISLPGYALRWVASASLYRRQPEQAAELYRQVLAGENEKNPEWLEDQRGLYYALMESGQFEAAEDLVAALVGSQPPRLFLLGNPEPVPNLRWLEAQELRANAYLQANDTPSAEQTYSDLVENAPNNSSLRTARAGLYLARGWPRRAEDELKISESTAPRNLALEVEQGQAARELQEWRQFDLLTDDVVQRYPESLQAQRLSHLREVHHMAEVRVAGYRGLGTGSRASGGHDLGIDAVAYSSPLNDDWRMFAGGGYATGDFEEGRGQHRWQRAGVEWRVRNHRVEAELSRHDFGHGAPLGLRLSGDHDFDDHWQYGWSLQRLSNETPLRALHADLTADSASGYLQWREDERRKWRLSSNAMHFSDGNNRLGLLLDGNQRVYTTPTWQVDLGLEIGARSNSGSDAVPYFNPGAEFGVMPSLTVSHILYQRYQTVWSQQAEVGLGSNSQRDYGAAAVGLLSYGQRLRFDDRFDGGLAISALSREYDGQREQEVRLLFDVNYRF